MSDRKPSRHLACLSAAELVVENLETDRPGVAGGHDPAHEAHHVEIAFARHVAEVARPVEQVHLDGGGIGELDEEDAVAGNAADGVGVDLAGKRVEAVEDQPDVRVIGPAHHFPGVAVVAHMLTPGQRLEPDAQAALRGPLAELAEVVGHAVDAAQRLGMDRGTDQHQIGAQLLHQVELAFGPVEDPRPQGVRQTFEIAKWLEQGDVQPLVAHHPAGIGRAAVEGDEILFEDLDAVVARRGDGFEFFGEPAADRDGGDRGFHDVIPGIRAAAAGRERNLARR